MGNLGHRVSGINKRLTITILPQHKLGQGGS
jgi:hypothetical protein